MKPFELIAVAILMLAAFSLLFTACSLTPEAPEISDEVVRIHIRANSNSECDQAVKLKVRDAVTEYLSEELKDCKDKQSALSVLKGESEKLTDIANSVLEANGFAYTSAVSVNCEHFPAREYGDYVFPDGMYDALILYLGEGVGDNWWCVAFPPLCFLPDGDGKEITYKSWVKEVLDKIFG